MAAACPYETCRLIYWRTSILLGFCLTNTDFIYTDLSEEKIPLHSKLSVSSDSSHHNADLSSSEKDFEIQEKMDTKTQDTSESNSQKFFDQNISESETTEFSQPATVQNTLIDIGSPKSSYSTLPEDANAPLSPSKNLTELVDPFAMLASSDNLHSPEPNSNILLDFTNTDTPESTSCDLINSATFSTRQEKPDLLPPTENVSLKRNKSLDDLNNDDFFASLEGLSKPSPKTETAPKLSPKDFENNLKVKQPFDPFMKHFHDTPRKSNSESNLLVDWGENISTDTLTPERHLTHSMSSNSLSNSQSNLQKEETQKSSKYDPFADLSFNFGSSSATPTTKKQGNTSNPSTVKTDMNHTATVNSNFARQAPQQPNYNIFVSSTDKGGFNKPVNKPQPTWGKFLFHIIYSILK